MKERQVYRLSLSKEELELLVDVKEMYGAQSLNDALHRVIGALNSNRQALDEILSPHSVTV